MIVDGIFQLKIGKVITGSSPWDNNIIYKVGDILTCGSKQWKVSGVDHIHQGCFGTPTTRYHALRLEPIGHDTVPAEGDDLI